MKSEDRRELILAAAAAVFGERGYVGATTDAVAKAAGVSQPYVVRMFGTKAALFQAVLDRSLDRLHRRVPRRDRRSTPPSDDDCRCASVGRYVDLLADRGLLLSLMQAFMLGADPEIGPTARAGFLRVYRLLRDEARLHARAGDRVPVGRHDDQHPGRAADGRRLRHRSRGARDDHRGHADQSGAAARPRPAARRSGALATVGMND